MDGEAGEASRRAAKKVSPFAQAMQLPKWADCPWELPDGIEARKAGDLVAFHRLGTRDVVGIVASRFDPQNLASVLAQLSGPPAPSPDPV